MIQKNRKIALSIFLTIMIFFPCTPLFNSKHKGLDPNNSELIEAIVIVDGTNNSLVDEILKDASIVLKKRWSSINGFSASMPYGTFERLENVPYVTVSQNGEFQICAQTLDWGVDLIDAEIVWGGYEDSQYIIPGFPSGNGVKVCVIDTGIDYTHPDLDDNYAAGYDVYDNDNDPMDTYGHGTHCAGIIAAENNDIGVVGVAPEASLYAVRVAPERGVLVENMVSGIDWAIANDMDVISMSIGGRSHNAALEQACAAAWNAGIVVVCASGNTEYHNDDTSVRYPAKYPSTIAVGAMD